jgi:hypothetical protein
MIASDVWCVIAVGEGLLSKEKGPARDRPSPDSPFKQSGNYPFVTIGGGGMLVPSLVMIDKTYRRLVWSSSAEKPHSRADSWRREIGIVLELWAAIAAKQPPMDPFPAARPEQASQICRIRENLQGMPHT